MESEALPLVKTPRIWTQKQIFWSSVIGGYLCGCYQIGQNYKALGRPDLAEKSYWAGAISTLLVTFCGILFFPDEGVKTHLFFASLAQGMLIYSYLIYEHYKAFYNKKMLLQCLCVLPFAALTIMAPQYLPAKWLAFTCTAVSSVVIIATLNASFAKTNQEHHLNELIERGIKKNSIGKLFGVAFLSLAIHAALAFSIVIIAYLTGLIE
jgi:hypothetical protein